MKTRIVLFLMTFSMMFSILPAALTREYVHAEESDRGEETHSINIYSDETKGKVEVPDGGKFKTGAKVTFTIKANAGFTVDSVHAFKSDFSEITTTEEGDNKYSFTMPDCDVMLQVQFTLKIGEGEHIVKVGAGSNSMTIINGDNTSNDELIAKAGDKIKVKHKGIGGKYLTELQLVTKNSKVDVPEVKLENRSGLDTEWSFTMPESSISINGEPVSMRTKYTVSVEPESLKDHVGKEGDTILGESITSYTGTNIRIDNVINGKYYVPEFTFTSNDSTQPAPKVTVKNVENDVTNYKIGRYLVTEAELKVKLVEADKAHKLINRCTDGNKLDINNGSTMSLAGNDVELVLSMNIDKGYHNSKAPVVKSANGKEISLEPVKSWNDNELKWKFNMPDQDVTIEEPEGGLLNVYDKYSINIEEASRKYISCDVDKAFPDSIFKFILTQPEKGHISYVRVRKDGKDYYFHPEEEGKAVKFKMLKGDVDVSAVISDAWTDKGNYNEELYKSPAGDWKLYNGADFAAFMLRMEENRSEFNGKTVTLEDDIDLSGHEWNCASAKGVALVSTKIDGKGKKDHRTAHCRELNSRKRIMELVILLRYLQ